jgi:hypothetical protein
MMSQTVLQRAHAIACILLFFSLRLHKPALSGARPRISKVVHRLEAHRTKPYIKARARLLPLQTNQSKQAKLSYSIHSICFD